MSASDSTRPGDADPGRAGAADRPPAAADRPPAAADRPARSADDRPEPVVDPRSDDDRDLGWGDDVDRVEGGGRDARWYEEQRPPHWE